MALSNRNILVTLLERATNPEAENVDELAVQMFSLSVRNDPNLIHEAMSLILSKIQSSNVEESIRGISLLQECMDKCGSSFQHEVSKFRFLNDLIRLVSNKHDGRKTPNPIRVKIMDCLLLWTTEYPNNKQIEQTYNRLRKEGIEHDHAPVANTVKKDTIMGVDEDKFRKLLQSKDTEDFKRANLLIQSRFNQQAKKEELMCRHNAEIQKIRNTASLLKQMLDSYGQNSLSEEQEDTISLINELYESCENYVPIIARLPELIDNSNEKLVDTLEVNEMLQAVIERYKATILKKPSPLENTSPKPSTIITTSDLLSGLLYQPEPIKPSPSQLTTTPNPLDELSEIFGSMDDSTAKIQRSLFDNMDLLEPSTVVQEAEQSQNEENNDNGSTKYDSRKLTEIDIMSEELLKASLKNSERKGTFKKEPERVSLNDLAKEKILNETSTTTSTTANLTKEIDSILLSPTLPTSQKAFKIEENLDENILFENHSKDELILEDPVEDDKPDQTIKQSKVDSPPVVHLADIHIDLDDICPTTEKLLFDDDIKITLNFTSNRPSRNVSVIVVSVTNQSKLPVTCFHLDASVRKPSKVRLLTPTGDSMPGIKPFRPPIPINLIMLLLNPTESDVDVTCIVGYKLGDDPDPIKESIVAKNIAYVE